MRAIVVCLLLASLARAEEEVAPIVRERQEAERLTASTKQRRKAGAWILGTAFVLTAVGTALLGAYSVPHDDNTGRAAGGDNLQLLAPGAAFTALGAAAFVAATPLIVTGELDLRRADKLRGEVALNTVTLRF
jgi:hypothetical protein